MPLVPPLQQPLGQVVASHEQVPVVASHRLFEQLVHEAPPVPHCAPVSEAYGTHVLPLQQPLGHDVELHSQTPPLPPLTHSWPEAHAAHWAPLAPQELFVSLPTGSHVFPLQQPSAQEFASQTHCPVVVLHSWPDGHPAQVAPLLPQELVDSAESASQLPVPVQQPAHDPPPHVHAPLLHESPDPHALHAAPPVPHCEVDCDA